MADKRFRLVEEMPSEMIQKPVSAPTLDRFKALVREREEELRDSDEEDDVAILSTDDIVRIYEVVLSELTLNSKPLITELTIIAGEQREHAAGIADVICTRIIEVHTELKLPSLYLLDSIVKNIGGVYIRYFSSRLPEVFVEAYRQVHYKQHPAMQHLFGTWSSVFPSSVLRKIGTELQFSSLVNHQSSRSTSSRTSESLSPRPTHGIHVNPKYLEARCQSEDVATVNMSTMDHHRGAARVTPFIGEQVDKNASASPEGWSGAPPNFDDFHNTKGVSSTLQRFGQKPSVGLGEYEMDNAEFISQQAGIPRRGSPGLAARSCITGLQGLTTPNFRLLRPPSPSRIWLQESLSASDDANRIETSPVRAFERASPLHSGFEYASDRLSKRNGEWNDRQMKHFVDHTRPPVEPNTNIEFDRQGPRALIDAYGNYRGESKFNGRPLKIEPLDVSGINSDATTRRWQNTEEEEYVWEDMSPTLADRSRSIDIIPPNLPLRNSSAREGFGRPSDSVTEPEYRAGYRPMQPQLPPVDNTSNSGNGGLIPGSNLGDAGAKSLGGFGNQNNATQIQGPKYFREPWNVHPHFPQSSHFHPKVSGNGNQISIPSIGTALSGGQRVPSAMDNTEVLSSMPQTTVVEKHFGQNLHSPLMTSQGLPQITHQNHIKGQFGLLDANRTQRNQSVKFDSFETKVGTVEKISQLPNQLPGSLFSNNHSQGPVASLQSQVPGSVAQENFITPIIAHVPSSLPPQPMSHGHSLHGHGALSSVMPNRLSGLPPIPNTSFQIQGGAKPPLPPGPPPVLQMGLPSQNVGPVASQLPARAEYTSLVNCLVAQGLITLPTPESLQEAVGVEFNPDVLKVRHESPIKAMYADLPRQCTTCGLRFKFQDDHSAHMDWHVTKNRVSKNRKKSSRKWFVNTSLWLSGAETLGSEAVPGFLLNEPVIEKKDDEVMAVPADENQTTCALCGESFDNFYSDETEEWMYKGAVYLNAPDGPVAGIDISQLGPIVHAKCRSESTVVSSDDLGLNGGEITADDSNHPKRMRV